MPDDGAAAHPFVAVAFVEPTGIGQRFGKRHWPLHVTLLRFDMAPEAALAAASGAISASAGLLPLRVRIGRDADFGYRGRVRVSLVEPHPGLQTLHESVRDAVAAGGGRIHSPAHTGRGFRPHVSVQGERRVRPGEDVRLEGVALVDMAPGGDTDWRVVTAQWGSSGGDVERVRNTAL